jgi:hypothetical protein
MALWVRAGLLHSGKLGDRTKFRTVWWPICSCLAIPKMLPTRLDRARSPADREPVAAVVIPRTVLAHHWFVFDGAKPQVPLLHWCPLAPEYG